ncbi:DUF2303 family protein [Bosea sp. ANAM02]|uniref:DUF2303 family protein n=1 Tax=Bosea sp. ANAM02 TaxID=2020412 RepID=UPI00140E98B8|nr:DUF2303 family protein [Bosea sp. ANAM02]BCB18024.1 hypothetical protein OCUBac02_09180 [Bosea sp. ANAM02]
MAKVTELEPATLEAYHEGALPNSDKGIAAVVELTKKSQRPEIVEVSLPDLGPGVPKAVPVIIDPQNRSVSAATQIVEAFRTKPAAKRGIATALTLQSFIDLTDRHKTDHTAVFANTDWKGPAFTAVVDYHDKASGGAADNLKHRIHYAFPLSEEWKVWIKGNGEEMEQREFAAFLEDRIADLTAPNDHERINLERDFATTIATPAQLIQLSRGLQVNVESIVKNVVNLATGEASIQFDEQHIDGNGQPLKVQGLFMLSIAPFFMGEKITIPARLRYRKSGQKILWRYQLYRPDLHVTERVRDDLITVAAQTALPTFEGSPEA